MVIRHFILVLLILQLAVPVVAWQNDTQGNRHGKLYGSGGYEFNRAAQDEHAPGGWVTRQALGPASRGVAALNYDVFGRLVRLAGDQVRRFLYDALGRVIQQVGEE